MSNVRKSFFKYLLEILIVTFGVVLGFFITDLRNKRSLEKKKKEGIELIKLELAENVTRLKKSINYHIQLDSFVQADFQKRNPEYFEEQFFENNFKTKNKDVYFLIEIIINDVLDSEKKILGKVEETINLLPY